MATAPERLLLRLEWRVIRRLDGRVQGAYRTPYRGSGLDFAGLRGYVEEDDARHIDWNVTARLDEPQVRQYTEDRELTVWLVLDRSASMTVGRPGRGKHDVLAELALILARLFGRGGNRVGAVLHDGAAARVVPPGTGRAHALRIGYELDRTAARRPGRGHHRLRRDARRGRVAGPAPVADRRRLRLHRHGGLGQAAAASGAPARRGRAAGRRRRRRRPARGRAARRRGRRDRRAAARRLRRPAVPQPGSGPAWRSGTPRSPGGCAGRGCRCTGSTPTATWSRPWSRSSPPPGGGAHEVHLPLVARPRRARRRGAGRRRRG